MRSCGELAARGYDVPVEQRVGRDGSPTTRARTRARASAGDHGDGNNGHNIPCNWT